MRLTAAVLAAWLVLGLIMASRGAEVQQPPLYRMGVLATANPRSTVFYRAFEERLRELGYAEGGNIAFEYRDAEGRVERLPGLARELVRLNVDAIVAATDLATRAARGATQTIPILIVGVNYDPVALKHVATLARPGGDVTGLFFLLRELTAKRFQSLRSAVRSHAEALFVLESAVIYRARREIADLALKQRLPTSFAFREYVDAGGLIAYGVSFPGMFRRIAEYADKILRGTKPADLPVEQPTQFELVINLTTAKTFSGSCQAICS